MKYGKVHTANGDIDVAKLVIGSAMNMGNLSKKELFEIFDRYVDAGGNCIDTARAYGNGAAEALVGEYLRTRSDADKIVISTKGCHPDMADGSPRLTFADMKADLHASLEALGREYVEIYWVHKDDESVPVETVIDGINRLMQTGKVGTVGCSNWSIRRMEAANECAKASGQQGFAMSQIQWNLAATKTEYFARFGSRVMEEADYDWYCRNGMPVFSFSPQAGGFFSKLANGGPESLRPDMKTNYATRENLIRYERLKALSEERNVPVSVPVLAYLINNKLPGWAVFGATKLSMLEETLQAAEYEMTAEEADAMYAVGEPG